jgi:hypothetical protein
MKSKWKLIAAIFQLVVGLVAVLSFIVLAANGENMTRWVVTFILSIAFVVLGIIGIIDYRSSK